jgi:hypothetical protein
MPAERLAPARWGEPAPKLRHVRRVRATLLLWSRGRLRSVELGTHGASLGPDSDVDRVRKPRHAAAARTLTHQAIECPPNGVSLVIGQVQAAQHHLDDRVAPHDPIPQLVAAAELGWPR